MNSNAFECRMLWFARHKARCHPCGSFDSDNHLHRVSTGRRAACVLRACVVQNHAGKQEGRVTVVEWSRPLTLPITRCFASGENLVNLSGMLSTVISACRTRHRLGGPKIPAVRMPFRSSQSSAVGKLPCSTLRQKLHGSFRC